MGNAQASGTGGASASLTAERGASSGGAQGVAVALGSLLKNESVELAKKSLGDFTAIYTKHVSLAVGERAVAEAAGGIPLPYTLLRAGASGEPFVMMGSLQKLGEVRKNWKQRFFVATEEADNFVVHYYESKEAHGKNPDKRVGSIDLAWYVVRPNPAHDAPAAPGCAFMAAPFDPADGRRVWHFRAETPEQAGAWMAVLANASRRARAPLRADPVYQGAFEAALVEFRAKHKLGTFHYIAQSEVQEVVAALIAEVGTPSSTVPGAAATQVGAARGMSVLASALSTVVVPAWTALSGTLDLGRPLLAETARENVAAITQKQVEIRQRVAEAIRTQVTGPALDALLQPILSATTLKALYQIQLHLFSIVMQSVVRKLHEIAQANKLEGHSEVTPLSRIPSFLTSSAAAPATTPAQPPAAPSGDAPADPLAALRAACGVLDREINLGGACISDALVVLRSIVSCTAPSQWPESASAIGPLFGGIADLHVHLPAVSGALTGRFLDVSLRNYARNLVATFLADVATSRDAAGALNLLAAKGVYDAKIATAENMHQLIEVQVLPALLARQLPALQAAADPVRQAILPTDKLGAFVDVDATIITLVTLAIKDACSTYYTALHAVEAAFLERLSGGVQLQLVPANIMKRKPRLTTVVEGGAAIIKGLIEDEDDIAPAVTDAVATAPAPSGWRCC